MFGQDSGAVTAFEAVFDIWPNDETPVDRLIPLIGNLTAADQHWIDPERSAALVGTEHIIMPGEAPILVVFALRRLRTLTPEAFCDYWPNKHAEFGRRPGNRYRQFHVDQVQSAKAAEAAGLAVTDFDGVAEASFADLAELQAVLASPEVAQGALADERRFIDHANSIFAICRAV